MKTRLIAGAAIVALVAGCQNNAGQNTAIGAVAGAAVGAAAGTLVGGNDRRNALVGAGIGLLAGAAVGYYLDDQEAQLRDSLRGDDATVTRTNNNLVVTTPSSVAFDVDSAKLKHDYKQTLNKIAKTLNADPRGYIDVVGHTDNTGSTAYNQQLSEARANAVREHLVRKGVDTTRILTSGRGETQPIASNASADGRAQNRRVEIIITPVT